MTRRRSWSRRLLGLVTGVALGVTTGLAVTGPGYAQDRYPAPRTDLSVRVDCDTEAREWVVTWTVATVAPRWVRAHELVDIDLDPAGSAVGHLPERVRQRVSAPFIVTQRLPGDATSASLSVRGRWFIAYDDHWISVVAGEPVRGTARLDGACRPTSPAPVDLQADSTCHGLVLTLTNPEHGTPVTAQVRPSHGEEQRVPLPPGASETLSFPDAEDLTVTVRTGDLERTVAWEPPECVPPDPGPVEVSAASSCDALTITFVNPRDGLARVATVTPSVGDPQRVPVPVDGTVEVTIPGAEGLTVDVAVEEQTSVFAWVPRDCTGEVPIGFASDCASLTIQITNPLVAGALEATVTTGEETRTVAVAPLRTAEVTLPARAGTVATVRADQEVVEAAWQPPAECAAAAPDPGPGEREATGGLPGTGSALAGTVLVAVTLVGIGVGLLLRSRRLPTRFLAHRTPRHRRPQWRRTGALAEVMRLLHIPAHRRRDA